MGDLLAIVWNLCVLALFLVAAGALIYLLLVAILPALPFVLILGALAGMVVLLVR